MDDAENLTKLLAHVPLDVFCAFMTEEFELAMPALDKKQSKTAQRETIASALTPLPVGQRQRIEEVAEKVILLTDGPGQDVVDGFRGEIFDGASPEAFDALRNQYERSLWLYRNAPMVFQEALDARQADIFRQNVSCYSGFVAPKHLSVATGSSAKDNFHQRVAGQLSCETGEVAVQVFKRLRPDAQVDEHVVLHQISIHHNRRPEFVDYVQQSQLVPQEVIRSESSYITYEPDNGHLEVLSRDSAGRAALARLVAATLLQSPISCEAIPLKQYDYQCLAAPRHFDTSGENISWVTVTELGYTVNNRSLLVKIWTNDPDSIYTAVRSLIGPTFDFRQHRLTYAKLCVRLKKVGKERARTIAVVLRDENKCNIKTKREKDRALCDRLVAKWGLVKEIDDVDPIHASLH